MSTSDFSLRTMDTVPARIEASLRKRWHQLFFCTQWPKRMTRHVAQAFFAARKGGEA